MDVKYVAGSERAISGRATLHSSTRSSGAERTVVDPVDHQLPPAEIPTAVRLHDLVQVPDRSDHQASIGAIDLRMMRKAVGYTFYRKQVCLAGAGDEAVSSSA
jgi:hypothetical protein